MYGIGNIKVIKPSKDFELVSGELIRSLDAETIGIYCKMLVLGEGWNLNVKGLSVTLKLSMQRIRKAMASLEDAGFLVKTAKRTTGGKMNGWDYILYGHSVKFTDIGENRTPVFPYGGEIRKTEKAEDNNNILKEINILKEKNIDICNNRESNRATRFVKPSIDEVAAYCAERKNDIDPAEFVDFYESKGWTVGKAPMKDWKASVRTWERSHAKKATATQPRRQESVFEHNLRVLDKMNGTNIHDKYYGNGK